MHIRLRTPPGCAQVVGALRGSRCSLRACASVEGAEFSYEDAGEAFALAWRDAEGTVDASSDTASERDALLADEGLDERDDVVDPEVAVELPSGRRQGVGDRVEGADDVRVRSEDVLLPLDEGREEAVARGETLAQERVEDGVGLVGVR